MKKFSKAIDDRKALVARLSELTGKNARYTRVPRCAYEVGAFAVEKDGSLTVEDGADERILDMLTAEGLIGPCTEGAPMTQAAGEVAPPAQPQGLGTEDWESDEWGDDHEAETAENDTQEVWKPDTDVFTETPTQEAEAPDPVTDAEYEQEAAEESAASLGVRDADNSPFPLEARISFPLNNHTAVSLTNLICMIYSRGALLSKATGGEFYADKELVDEILDKHNFLNAKELIGFVKVWNSHEIPLKGISFEGDTLCFDGFTSVPDEAHLQTFTRLAAAMNKMALTQKRVQAKDTDDSNEKYSLRIWVVRLGMNGSENKQDRKILMEHLSGHTAFRNEAERERWTARQQAKRDALRAAKAASAGGEVTV